MRFLVVHALQSYLSGFLQHIVRLSQCGDIVEALHNALNSEVYRSN